MKNPRIMIRKLVFKQQKLLEVHQITMMMKSQTAQLTRFLKIQNKLLLTLLISYHLETLKSSNIYWAEWNLMYVQYMMKEDII